MIVTVYEGSHASQQFYTFFKSSLRHKKIGKFYVFTSKLRGVNYVLRFAVMYCIFDVDVNLSYSDLTFNLI
jgi:hypothetical protein